MERSDHFHLYTQHFFFLFGVLNIPGYNSQSTHIWDILYIINTTHFDIFKANITVFFDS